MCDDLDATLAELEAQAASTFIDAVHEIEAGASSPRSRSPAAASWALRAAARHRDARRRPPGPGVALRGRLGRVERRRRPGTRFSFDSSETVNTAPRPCRGAPPARCGILLVEDDDGDALLVEELLDVAARRASRPRATLAEARARATWPRSTASCSTSTCPTPRAWTALHRLRRGRADIAVLVLTGLDDERRGIEAVGAGAQDYLVKGQVDGTACARAVRYAVERRRADEARQQLEVARLHAEENARLERGLLPAPLVDDAAARLTAHYRPGRRRALLGGDFYDAVETADGAVHAVIGDVCGHGPGRGGARRRAAHRLAHAGARRRATPTTLLPTLQVVLGHERHTTRIFTTLCDGRRSRPTGARARAPPAPATRRRC